MADVRAQLESLLERMETQWKPPVHTVVGFSPVDIEAVRSAIPAEDVATVLNALTRAGDCFICKEPEAHVHKPECALGRWGTAGGDPAARFTE